MSVKERRKYRRQFGYCGESFDQNEMVRTYLVKDGWLCKECYKNRDSFLYCIRKRG